MKHIAVKILVGVLAVGAVGGGGYFLWKRHKKRKAEDELIEVEHIPFKEYKQDVSTKDDKANDIPELAKEKFAKRLDTYVQSAGEKENFELYLSEMESPEDDEPDEEDELEYEDEEDEPPSSGVYLITAGEFCNNRTYYDKVSLNYFAGDGVVADDRDEIMENADTILGDLQSAFSGPRASNVIYIRNEELEVDYEVSFVDGSYRKEVLNLDEEV